MLKINQVSKILVVSFSGQSYMRFTTPVSLKDNSVSIWLTIRHEEGTGVILYAEKAGHKKFLALTLNDSYLELR